MELNKIIDELFDKHGAVDIINALAHRCRGEASIAEGESRDRSAYDWTSLAEDLETLATDHEDRQTRHKDE